MKSYSRVVNLHEDYFNLILDNKAINKISMYAVKIFENE